MASYSFRYVASGGVVQTEEKTVDDDRDALELARIMCRSAEVVIWDKHRLVERAGQNDEPPLLRNSDGR